VSTILDGEVCINVVTNVSSMQVLEVISILKSARKSQVVVERAVVVVRITIHPHSSQGEFDTRNERPWDKQMCVRAKLERRREEDWEEERTSMFCKMTEK